MYTRKSICHGNNHKTVLDSFGIPTDDSDLKLSCISLCFLKCTKPLQTSVNCWILKLFYQTSIHVSYEDAIVFKRTYSKLWKQSEVDPDSLLSPPITSVPPRGNFRGYDFLKAYEKCYKMSHVCTLAVGAFRILGVKREKLCKKSLKIGNNF